jgi:glycosyltransferase involved in cell wall biosynthesis
MLANETLREKPIPPIVSVIMPNYNGAAFISEAIGSACRQSLSNIEIIVSDDGSTDISIEIVSKLMSQDPRIRFIRSDRNRGPAAARNRAIAVASGEWIAVLDNDDLMHPERLATLVECAARDEADIVADDLLFFDTDHVEPPRPLLRGRSAKTPFWLDIERYVRANRLFAAGPALGYLKPLFRSSLLRATKVRYDERLRISEDFDFVFRLLTCGAKFRVYPFLRYFYRRRNQSLSHRLTPQTIEAMRTVDREIRRHLPRPEPKLAAAMDGRSRSIDTAFMFDKLVRAIKRRDVTGVVRIGVKSPRAVMLLRLPVAERAKRLAQSAPRRIHRDGRQVCVLSRQRLIGRTNGSSTYLLDLVEALAQRGLDVHFVSPSPTTLGRWPYLALKREMTIFNTIRVRGTWRVGQYLIAASPWTFVQGLLALGEKLLLKAKLISRPVLSTAPYAVACPLTREDQLFLAKQVPTVGDVLIADYCYLTDAFPYALRPDSKTAVVMHDLFSSRARQFASLGSSDSVVDLTEAAECSMLARADTIVAIQREEGEFLRSRIPPRRIIVAPMAAKPVGAPQPGRSELVLFVGSSAAANLDGLSWFLESCWPEIRVQRSAMVLKVAGTVCQKVGAVPAGVKLLGLVDDLAPLYAACGLVVSPLRAGSGLKIKLIEALAHGKAVIATTVTLQGVDDTLRDCVRVADEPHDFAAAVLDLASDEQARIDMAARGLAAVTRYFSHDISYGEFVEAMS